MRGVSKDMARNTISISSSKILIESQFINE